MKILFLGYENSPLISHIQSLGDSVLVTNDKINTTFIRDRGIEFIVSYGYRYIIKPDVINALPNKVVNLHIAFLPWNRGADPNFWSFVENTPKGVTIHYIDEGMDTGDIIAQEMVSFDEEETLKSSYDKLQVTIQELFKKYWPQIKLGTCPRKKQVGEGTTHYLKDKNELSHLLILGWDTPVKSLVRK